MAVRAEIRPSGPHTAPRLVNDALNDLAPASNSSRIPLGLPSVVAHFCTRTELTVELSVALQAVTQLLTPQLRHDLIGDALLDVHLRIDVTCLGLGVLGLGIWQTGRDAEARGIKCSLRGHASQDVEQDLDMPLGLHEAAVKKERNDVNGGSRPIVDQVHTP